MSQFFSKLGLTPKWGNVWKPLQSVLASKEFRDKLAKIRKQKLENPEQNVSQEIKDLLEENK